MSSAQDLIKSRELLWNLTLRDLRGRYKRSILGWGWSLLNPIAFMLIYTFAFSVILTADPPAGLTSGLRSYPLYLMCGLLPWSFFNVSVSAGMVQIVENAPLIKKVAFPQEHLVVSTVFAGLFTLGIEMGILSLVLVVAGNMIFAWLPAVLLAAALLMVFTIGVALFLAAVNVFFRDTNYLWSILSQAWFFSTPIVYPEVVATSRLAHYPVVLAIYNKAPMTVFVRVFRRLLYDLRVPSLLDVSLMVVYAGVALAIGWATFNRFERRFAEEL